MYRRTRIIGLTLVLLQGIVGAAAAATSDPPATYLSPDQTLRALVVGLPNAPYGKGESRIEIRDANNHLLFEHSFGSKDAEHGFGVEKAAWTPDSQFFAFSMSSSGGHQAWHFPTHFVSRRDNKLRSLDDYLGPITQADFEVKSPDIVQTIGRKRADLELEPFKVRLSELQKQKKVEPAKRRR